MKVIKRPKFKRIFYFIDEFIQTTELYKDFNGKLANQERLANYDPEC